MRFTDNVERDLLSEVYVVRTEQEMEAREEFHSLLWEVEIYDFSPDGRLYQTVARDVKVGELIYTKEGRYIGYRAE